MEERYREMQYTYLLALRLREEATSQRMWAASGSWKDQGNGFSREPPERPANLLTSAHFCFIV